MAFSEQAICKMALRVRDVTFPGNIACNCRSNSENIASPKYFSDDRHIASDQPNTTPGGQVIYAYA